MSTPPAELRCNCESSFCNHRDPVKLNILGNPVPAFAHSACSLIPSGRVTMDYVGDVCEFCAANVEASGGGQYLHRSARVED